MKRPLHVARAMIAGAAVATSSIVACSLAMDYTAGEVIAVSLIVAGLMLVMFIILWLINRRRAKR